MCSETKATNVLLGLDYGWLAALLGPAAGRLATLAKGFPTAFNAEQVRGACLAGSPWLLVATEDASAYALPAGSGLPLPWPAGFQVDVLLFSEEANSIFGMSCETTDSVLCCWRLPNGTEMWRRQTGTKLLQPLVYIAKLKAVGAGCFEGVQMWDESDGSATRYLKTELPVDRIWHFPQQELICARGSEILGLTTHLSTWSVDALAASTGDSPVWEKSSNEMVMALAGDGQSLFARVGSVIHAWDGKLGKELWQRAQIELPRLPTLPTYLQLDTGVLYVGAGSFLLALRTEDGALHFMTSLPGSLLKLYTSPEPHAGFAALLRSDTYALAHISPSKGELFAPRLGTAAERVSCSLNWRWMVVLAVVFDGDRG
eukprot:s5335_g1.t1